MTLLNMELTKNASNLVPRHFCLHAFVMKVLIDAFLADGPGEPIA
jgi:hypothetical protein